MALGYALGIAVHIIENVAVAAVGIEGQGAVGAGYHGTNITATTVDGGDCQGVKGQVRIGVIGQHVAAGTGITGDGIGHPAGFDQGITGIAVCIGNRPLAAHPQEVPHHQVVDARQLERQLGHGRIAADIGIDIGVAAFVLEPHTVGGRGGSTPFEVDVVSEQLDQIDLVGAAGRDQRV